MDTNTSANMKIKNTNLDHNLENDITNDTSIIKKAISCEIYSQNLYAALCNNDFQKQEVWSILKGLVWSCSWRYAGDIVSKIRDTGSYMDWYCSGINDFNNDTISTQPGTNRRIVVEGEITREISEDLKLLKWKIINLT